MIRRLFGSKFLKKMNTLMETYALTHNAEATYKQLNGLKGFIRTKGEKAWYELNRASLLYDMNEYEHAADIIREIPPLNPEFDARCAQLMTKIMNEL